MADFEQLPSGVKILSTTPAGEGGQALNHNFELLGARSAGYTHVQSVAASTWTIAHNLGKPVSVTVTDSAGTVCIGAIRIIDMNTVEVSFSSAFSGRCYVV